MDINIVASVLTEQTKINTLDKVNVNLLKKSNEQAEQLVSQLIDSIPAIAEGNKGNNVDKYI